jgi:hypothetical protein
MKLNEKFVKLMEKKKEPKVKYEFKKNTYEQFERLVDSSTAYEETEIDGHPIMYCNANGNCIAIYYNKYKFASVCKDFKGDYDDFAYQDTNWPYGD